eukprot:COSAG06_NODE_7852_length_2352_cov_296.342654_3_plen_45_part_00
MSYAIIDINHVIIDNISFYDLSQIVIVFESWREDGTQSEHLCTF